MFLQIFGFFERIWYDGWVLYFSMRIFSRIIFVFLMILSLVPWISASDDITKPDFQITLSNLDPFSSSTQAQSFWGRESALALLMTLSNLLLFAVPLIAAVAFIVAGYYYILSSGDSEKASQAKTIIKWNIIAIIIALFSYALIILIAKMLDGSLL